jgi:AcrR family transcriptional regulator
MGSASLPPALRRDAQANRDKILAAARERFAAVGLDASMDEIALRAGVGMGTLYRRFPNKDALIETIFEEHLDELASAAESCLTDDDPWQGFRRFLEHAASMHARNRGFAEIITMRLRDEQLLTRARARLVPLVGRLIERAQAHGSLRADIVYEDISVLHWTIALVAASTRDIAPEFWRRYVELVLDALRATGASPLPEPPLTPSQNLQATDRLARPAQRRR